VTYAEAMDALLHTYLALRAILRLRLGHNTRAQLELLAGELGRLLSRDNGRRR
jgi:hypothetical protein